MDSAEIRQAFIDAISQRPYCFDDLKNDCEAVISRINSMIKSNIEIGVDLSEDEQGNSLAFLAFSRGGQIFAEIQLTEKSNQYKVLIHKNGDDEENVIEEGETFKPNDKAKLARVICGLLPDNYKQKLIDLPARRFG